MRISIDEWVLEEMSCEYENQLFSFKEDRCVDKPKRKCYLVLRII